MTATAWLECRVLLAVDVGNTNIVLGVFRGESLLASWRLDADPERMSDEYAVLVSGMLHHSSIGFGDLHGVVVSSVVPRLTSTFRELARRYLNREPVVVSSDLKTGVVVATENPREVGADRIVNALAAMHRHRVPAIIVDFGTATTFDAVSEDGRLLGTAIAPGFFTSLQGLYSHAARLSAVDMFPPASAIGRNTADSLRSGAIFGYAGLVEGLVRRISRELGGTPIVIATGGLAEMVLSETSVFDVHDPDLTLHGLRLFYELNT